MTNAARLCCCAGTITCTEWCACLPATCTVNSVQIVIEYKYYRGGHVYTSCIETLTLSGIAMTQGTDLNGCCAMISDGGSGNGTVSYSMVRKTYVKTCSNLDADGCPHTSNPVPVLKDEESWVQPLTSIGAGQVIIRCSDPCNASPPCPDQSWMVMDIDIPALTVVTEYTDYCVPGNSVPAYTTSRPIYHTFIDELRCLDSVAFQRRGLRNHYMDTQYSCEQFIGSGCVGEQFFGWTCSATAPFVTTPQYETSYDVETCETDVCNSHVCYSSLGPPAVISYECVCNFPTDCGFVKQYENQKRSHTVSITV